MSRTTGRDQNRIRYYHKHHRLGSIGPTESTRAVLGGGWHSHHNSRLAERRSKQHAKRNAHRQTRLQGQLEAVAQLEELRDVQ